MAYSSSSSQTPTPPQPQFYVPPTLQHLSIHLDTFLNQNPHIDRLAVGGLIFHPNTANARPNLLLLQRSSSGRSFQRIWEVPGGTCETNDITILHSLVREVFGETGMQVNNVVAQVGEIEYMTLKGVRWAKICFLVGVEEVTGREEVANVPVRIDRRKHRAFRWKAVDELQTVEAMTEGQREIMRVGFTAFEDWCNEGNTGLGERLVLLYL